MNAASVSTSFPAPLTLGHLQLDIQHWTLIGPRGTVALRPTVYALAERLMRRPGVVVAHSDLVSAMYPNPI